MCSWQRLILPMFLAIGLAHSAGAASREASTDGKFYRIVGGRVDARTYNGFRRYHSACNHCHGPDGMGSTFASSLIDRLPDIDAFRQFVLGGVSNDTSVMKGFAADPNIAPFVDDIYAYLQARADGALARGRPRRFGQP